MDCRWIRSRLTEAAVSGKPEARFTQHLETCVSCAAELHRLRTAFLQLERQLDAELSVEVPRELAARVRQKLAVVPPSHGVGFHRVLTAGLALALVVAIVLVVTRPSVQTQAPESTPARSEGPPDVAPRHTAEKETPVTVSSPLRPSPATRAASTQPWIVVPPGQEAAILRFYQSSRDTTRVPAAPPSPVAPVDVPRLYISPLESTPLGVEPIDISSLTENIELLGHRQRR